MKLFLVEIRSQPNNTLCFQYGTSLASVAIMAENGKLPLVSVRELTDAEYEAMRSTVPWLIRKRDFSEDKLN